MQNETIKVDDLTTQNKTLQDISRLIFGDKAEMRVVEPKSLQLLRENARYFKKDEFKQLVDNLKNDQRLSGTPLCHVLENGALEVLSGNHRVKASIEAGLQFIFVIVITENLAKNKQIAIQLSHNALAGVDDCQILADLWAKIDDIKEKAYAGLSSDTLQELQHVKLQTFSTPQPKTKHIVFAFTELEMEHAEKVMDELSLIPADTIHLSTISHFGDFMRDPEMIFVKVNDQVFPCMFQQDGGWARYEESVRPSEDGKIMLNRPLQKDHAVFAGQWLKNIAQQQHV